LSLTDQVLSMGDGRVTADRVRDALGLVAEDEFIAMLDIIADRRAADVFPAVAKLGEAGVDFGGVLTGLADILRAQLAVVLGGTAPDVSDRGRVALAERRDRFSAADLLRMLQAITELEPRFRKSGQQQLLVETLLVRFALLDRAVEIEDLLRSMGGSPAQPSAPREGTARPTSTGAAQAAPFARPEPRSVPRADAPSPRHEASSRIAPPVAAQSSLAQAAPANRPAPPEALELTKVTGKWDDLVERMRENGKPMVATALAHASPAAVTADGVVLIALDEPNDIYAHAVSTSRAEIAAALRTWFAGVDRVELRRDESAAPQAPPKRLTDEMVRAERIAALRKRDPVLNAAIDALDLDVAD
jgi:DNA polymerase-3 subunit gamma/tau